MLKIKQILTTLLIFTITANLALGDCPNAVSLNVGDKVSDCNRIGLSVDYDLKVRKQLIDADYNNKLLEAKDKLLSVKDLALQDADSQVKLWKDEATRSRKEADDARDSANTRFWVGIGVGFLAILLSAKVVNWVK